MIYEDKVTCVLVSFVLLVRQKRLNLTQCMYVSVIFPASKSHKGEPLLLFKALPLRVRVTADVCAAGLFEETPDDIQLFGGVVSISAFML